MCTIASNRDHEFGVVPVFSRNAERRFTSLLFVLSCSVKVSVAGFVMSVSIAISEDGVVSLTVDLGMPYEPEEVIDTDDEECPLHGAEMIGSLPVEVRPDAPTRIYEQNVGDHGRGQVVIQEAAFVEPGIRARKIVVEEPEAGDATISQKKSGRVPRDVMNISLSTCRNRYGIAPGPIEYENPDRNWFAQMATMWCEQDALVPRRSTKQLKRDKAEALAI